eukprot:1137557-Pelagomonas_calceolata.AAC.1
MPGQHVACSMHSTQLSAHSRMGERLDPRSEDAVKRAVSLESLGNQRGARLMAVECKCKDDREAVPSCTRGPKQMDTYTISVQVQAEECTPSESAAAKHQQSSMLSVGTVDGKSTQGQLEMKCSFYVCNRPVIAQRQPTIWLQHSLSGARRVGHDRSEQSLNVKEGECVCVCEGEWER